MITNLAVRTVAKLKKSGAIAEGDRELFVYGFFLIYSNLMVIAIILLSGIAFGAIWESVFFYCMFTPLRNFAGGIHARTEVACNIATTIVLTGAVFLMRTMKNVDFAPIYIAVMLFSAAIVIALSPLDSEGKRLTDIEKACYKKKSVFVTIVILIVGIVSLPFQFSAIFCAAVVSVTLEALLLLAQCVSI